MCFLHHLDFVWSAKKIQVLWSFFDKKSNITTIGGKWFWGLLWCPAQVIRELNLKKVEKMQDESDITSDKLTESDKDKDTDKYVSNLEWTNDIYNVNLPASWEPNGHTHKHSLTKDAMQFNYLSLFWTESFYETNFLFLQFSLERSYFYYVEYDLLDLLCWDLWGLDRVLIICPLSSWHNDWCKISISVFFVRRSNLVLGLEIPFDHC